MTILKAFFAAVGLSLLLAYVFAVLSCNFGMLFGGIDLIFAVVAATAFCSIAVPATVVIFKRKNKPFTQVWLAGEVALLAMVAVGFLSWFQTRDHMTTFVGPKARGVHVIKGRMILFSSYVHFSAPPDVIAAIIQSKGLLFVPDTPPEGSDWSAYSQRQRTLEARDWWQPAAMSNPKFFFLYHSDSGAQGWTEGWWVNGETIEVYARIGG